MVCFTYLTIDAHSHLNFLQAKLSGAGGCKHNMLPLHIITRFPTGSPIKAHVCEAERNCVATMHEGMELTCRLSEIPVSLSLRKINEVCDNVQHFAADEATAFKLDCPHPHPHPQGSVFMANIMGGFHNLLIGSEVGDPRHIKREYLM